MTADERIAELEREREEINIKARKNAEQRSDLKDEYDALINRRLEAQKEINAILQGQIAEIQKSRSKVNENLRADKREAEARGITTA